MDSRKTRPSARAAAASATTSGPQHGHIAQTSVSDMSSSSAPSLALRKKPKKRLSSGAAAQRDESEFVSVEVGMREFQRRLASSKSKDSSSAGNKTSSRSFVESSEPSASRGQSRDKSDGVLSPALEQPKKRARTTTTRAAPPTTASPSTPSASSAVSKSAITAAASRARKPAASDPSVLKDPVKTPRKRAAATTTPASAKAKAPTTATAAIRKPRAAPVARRQTTIAEIRAQLLREQQERAELRIQTLHCANCNSVTHAHADGHVHTHAQAPSVVPPVTTTVVEPHRSIYQQQQEQQPVASPFPAQQTHSIQQQQQHIPVSPSQPPPPMLAQHTAQPQAPAIRPNPTTSTATLPVPQAPVAAPVPIAQPTAAVSEPDPIKNEFISDDFSEDMAFMMALDEVERSLTMPTKPSAPILPARPPPSSSSNMYQHFSSRPTQQLEAGSGGAIKQEPTDETQRDSSQLVQDIKNEPSQVHVLSSSVSCHSRTTGAHVVSRCCVCLSVLCRIKCQQCLQMCSANSSDSSARTSSCASRTSCSRQLLPLPRAQLLVQLLQYNRHSQLRSVLHFHPHRCLRSTRLGISNQPEKRCPRLNRLCCWRPVHCQRSPTTLKPCKQQTNHQKCKICNLSPWKGACWVCIKVLR